MGWIRVINWEFHYGGQSTFYNFGIVAVLVRTDDEIFLETRGIKNYLRASVYSFMIYSYYESIRSSFSFESNIFLKIEFYGIWSEWMILFLSTDLNIFKAWKNSKHLGGLILKSQIIPLSSTSINFKMECIKAILRSGKKNEVIEKADVQCHMRE